MNAAAGEGCDDGGRLPGDGCDGSCRVEPGYTCAGPGVGQCAFTCGNTVMTGQEACDDGNLLPGDGCSEVCAVEDGYVCIPAPGGSVCAVPPPHAQCVNALDVMGGLSGESTAFAGTLLPADTCAPAA